MHTKTFMCIFNRKLFKIQSTFISAINVQEIYDLKGLCPEIPMILEIFSRPNVIYQIVQRQK